MRSLSISDRLRKLLPLNINIQQVGEKLENYFQHFQLQNPKQIQNTIQHIYTFA